MFKVSVFFINRQHIMQRTTIYSRRIKPKKDHPWKFKDIVKLLSDEFEWTNIKISRPTIDTEPGCTMIQGETALLCRSDGLNSLYTTIKQNYYRTDYHEDGKTIRKEFESLEPCGIKTSIIETDDDKIIKFLLSKPQFYTNS